MCFLLDSFSKEEILGQIVVFTCTELKYSWWTQCEKKMLQNLKIETFMDYNNYYLSLAQFPLFHL